MGETVMKCKYCEAELSADIKVCPVCGADVTEEVLEVASATEEAQTDESVAIIENVVEPTATVAQPECAAPVKDPGKVFGIISLILGVAGFVLGIIFPCACCTGCAAVIGNIPFVLMSVAAIALGIIGNIRSKKVGIKNTKATVGLIFGIVGVAFIVTAMTLSGIMGSVYASTACFEALLSE